MTSKRDFKYNFDIGQNLFYKIKITGNMLVSSPMGEVDNPIDILLKISQKVVDIESEIAILDMAIIDAEKGPSMGDIPLPEIGQVSKLKINLKGKASWLAGQPSWQGAEFSQMEFPQNSIAPGDSWVQEFEPGQGGALPYFSRYTYLEDIKSNDSSFAVFGSELFIEENHGLTEKELGTGNFRFNIDEGCIEGCSNDICHHFKMPLPENPALLIETTTNLKIEMERI